MKNIEKYTNTKDALDAYNSLDYKTVPFDTWLESEYEEPRVPTLLEAAKAVTTSWFEKGAKGSLAEVSKRICTLSSAIEREKRKPVRNCDKYKTAEEAYTAFMKMCCDRPCLGYEFDSSKSSRSCRFSWLYDEAVNEEAK